MRQKTRRKLAEAKHTNQQKVTKESLGQTLVKASKKVPLDRAMRAHEKLRRETALPAELPESVLTLPEKLPLVAELVDDRTPEQRAVQEAGDAVRALMLKDEGYQTIMESMIALRQGYAVAYKALQAKLAKEENLHSLTEDVIIGAAAFHAAKPFGEHQVVHRMIERVMPFLADVLDTDIRKDREERRKEEDEKRKLRLCRALPLGFKHHAEMAEPVLARDRALVLVGWRPAVRWLIDQAVKLTLEAAEQFSILHFHDRGSEFAKSESRCLRFPVNVWCGCGNTSKELTRTLAEYVGPALTHLPDLVVCDAIDQAHTLGFIGRDRAASAGDAHKVLRRYCDAIGAGLLCGVGYESREPVDARSSAFEQLRTFAHLRRVHVEADVEGLDPTKYRIIVHEHTAVFEVAKAEVDALQTAGRSLVAP